MSERACAIRETGMVLRWAAQVLTPTERAALEGLALGRTEEQIASSLPVGRSGVWMARQSGLEKMRRRLALLRIRRAEDLLL